MIYGKSIYPGEAWTTPDERDPQDIERLTKAHAEIQSLYLAGAAVFTRATILDVAKQLTKLEGKSGKVSVRCLNGDMVEFAIETGRILLSMPDTEYIIRAPFIYYCTIQELTSTSRDSVSRIAYSSLRIYHYMDFRDKSTKEIIDVMGNIIPTESPEGTKEIFETNKQRWEESEKYKQITSILQSISSSINIQQIVAFACGAIRHDFDYTPRSSFQHSLVLTLREILGEKQGDLGGVSCYAQDPVYSEVDKLILRENGFTVLEDPYGFLKVDDSPFVVSFAPEVPVKQIILDLARPAAMIWERIKEEENLSMRYSDPGTSRIWETIQECYDMFEIPGNTENFGDVVLYVRREVIASTVSHTQSTEGDREIITLE